MEYLECPECCSDNIDMIDESTAECLHCRHVWTGKNESPFGSTDDQVSGLGGYDDSLGDDL
ncbi:MAG: hypothetical protein ACYC27_07430 [Armatimonadota bacterium]